MRRLWHSVGARRAAVLQRIDRSRVSSIVEEPQTQDRCAQHLTRDSLSRGSRCQVRPLRDGDTGVRSRWDAEVLSWRAAELLSG
jgi:hypothetical protein